MKIGYIITGYYTSIYYQETFTYDQNDINSGVVSYASIVFFEKN